MNFGCSNYDYRFLEILELKTQKSQNRLHWLQDISDEKLLGYETPVVQMTGNSDAELGKIVMKNYSLLRVILIKYNLINTTRRHCNVI